MHVVDPDARRAAKLERVGGSLAFLAMFLGAVVLWGWAADVRTLKSVHPSLVAMNPLTAVAFVLAGGSLAFCRPARRRSVPRGTGGLATLLALAVLGIASIRLLGYFGADLGIDRLFFSDLLEAEPIPNRMAPNTAAAFLLVGGALLGLTLGTRGAAVAQGLALLVLAISLVTLCGYAYRSATLVRVREFIPMALHTAVGFSMLSIGILCARPRRALLRDLTSGETGGRIARRLAIPTVAIPIVLGWLRLRGESAGAFDSATGAALMAVTWTAILGSAMWWLSRVLNRADGDRSAHEERIEKLNRELQDRAIEVEATNRELEAFSYSVSHDLRAPLRSITGFSQALLEDCADSLDERGRDYLDRVVRAGRKMADLIEDIMTLSRITRAEMQRVPVDLTETATEIASELSLSQPGRSVDVRIEPGLHVRGDPKLLRIALANLLENAWKFTGRVSEPRVELGALVGDNGSRVFYVRDNGAGFEMRHAERLFGPFQRLHSELEFPGTGVGLATVQRVVRRHGGRIWAEASVARGATFFFTVEAEGGSE